MELDKKYILKAMNLSNFLDRVKPLIESGRMYIDKDEKIKPQQGGTNFNTPWIMSHTEKHEYFNCIKFHRVMFPCFGVIPKECFNCYKVVVRPRTVIELLKLHELQKSLPDSIPSKCGIEERAYTPALYGGYFYNIGLEAGQEKYEFVRELIDKEISPDIKVYLKRACTEYEMQFGNSDEWKLDPDEQYYSAWVDKVFDDSFFHNELTQPDYVKLYIIMRWIRFAYEHGDNSYLEISDGEPLFDEPITYNKGEE